MEGTRSPSTRARKGGSYRAAAALSQEESRQLLYFHGRLVLEQSGFQREEINRLVFFKWLHLRGRFTEFPGAKVCYPVEG